MSAVGQAEAGARRFEALFTHLYSPLYGLVYRVLGDRLESEDTLQEAFLRLASPDHEALLARPDEEVAAWLRRVSLNLAFNRVRDRRRAQERLERVGRLDGVGQPSEMSSAPATAVVEHELQASVRDALATLPERQRLCLLLRHSGYAYAEIATTLGVAVGSVGVLLARAERAFKAAYQSREPLDPGSTPV